VYGTPNHLPINESHPQTPVNPYGFSKHAAERFINDFSKAYDIPFAALRYFNASGADPEGEVGELHDPETHLIPLAIDTALGIYPHLQIYGTDYPTPDGTAIRDYIHVSDLADAHVKALNYLLHTGNNLSINIGTGKGYSVRQVISAVEAVAASSVRTIETSRREGDPPVLVADTTLCRSILQWHPRYSDLRQIIETAWSWHRQKHLLTI
jgi:UDP-glucose-4-epimerase GalE